MRRSLTEYAIMINFDFSLNPVIPLGTQEKLANSDFPIAVSFAYGDNDWTRVVDEDFA